MVSSLVRKLNKILGARLKGFHSGLEHGTRNDRVTGFIVSADFAGLDHAGRQSKLSKLLEKSLTQEELTRVGPIVTMTPTDADIGNTQPAQPSTRASGGRAA